MPTLGHIFRDFTATCQQSRALFNFCLQPLDVHSNAGVEAAFLQVFKAWEGFLEESFIAYMRGRLSRHGLSAAGYINAPNDDIARAVIYQHRPYAEWTNPDDVRARGRWFFSGANCFETAIRPIIGELRHMGTLRNAIAHASPTAKRKMQDLAQGVFGGKPTITRPAALLVNFHPATRNITFFDHYVNLLEVAADAITS